MRLERKSPCKINLLLNVLGRRADGFHELEMVMHPVGVFDTLLFERSSEPGIELKCSDARLPTDSSNLVFRAASRFLEAARLNGGVRIYLEKRVPMAAGLGGGSSNAAHTLLGLNDLFDRPLSREVLFEMAASLGSDVPFFLQSQPAAAFGRGERIVSHPFFSALANVWLILIYPGFGIATAWAYKQLSKFPRALNGDPGRVEEFLSCLQTGDLESVGRSLYNSLEAPALRKYPVLALYQDFLKEKGAFGALMSGSGSTTFGLVRGEAQATDILESFRAKFGHAAWCAILPAK